MLVLRRIYVVIEGIAVAGGRIEVVGKAVKGLIVVIEVEVVVYVLVIAGVCGLEAVSEISKVYKV